MREHRDDSYKLLPRSDNEIDIVPVFASSTSILPVILEDACPQSAPLHRLWSLVQWDKTNSPWQQKSCTSWDHLPAELLKSIRYIKSILPRQTSHFHVPPIHPTADPPFTATITRIIRDTKSSKYPLFRQRLHPIQYFTKAFRSLLTGPTPHPLHRRPAKNHTTSAINDSAFRKNGSTPI